MLQLLRSDHEEHIFLPSIFCYWFLPPFFSFLGHHCAELQLIQERAKPHLNLWTKCTCTESAGSDLERTLFTSTRTTALDLLGNELPPLLNDISKPLLNIALLSPELITFLFSLLPMHTLRILNIAQSNLSLSVQEELFSWLRWGPLFFCLSWRWWRSILLTIYIIRVTLNTESDTVDIRRRPAYMAYP